jgi:hypothetical protein
VFEVVTQREKGKEKTNSENRGSTSKPYGKVRSFFSLRIQFFFFFHFSLVRKLDCHDMISVFFVANGGW